MRVLLLGVLLGAMGWSAGLVGAASDTVIVTAEVVGASMLTNDCRDEPATFLGAITTNVNVRTATDPADVCRVGFGASSDAAQLRIGQRDGEGRAMSLAMQDPVWQERMNLPGRTSAVRGLGTNSAVGVGRAGMISRTQGTGWTEFTVGPTHHDVDFVPATTEVWIVGDNASVRRSTDVTSATNPTFTTYTVSSPWPATGAVRAIKAFASNNVLVAGDDGWVARRTAGGWTTRYQIAGVGDITSLDASSTSIMTAVTSSGRILMTTDGGDDASEWTTITAPNATGVELTSVAVASGTRQYVTGTRGYVAVWNGSTWTDRSEAIRATSDLTSVTFRPGSPNTVYVAEENGKIHVSTNAGVSWSVRESGTLSHLVDVDAANASTIFYAGFERTWGRSTDGGATFEPREMIGSTTLADIAASPIDGRRIIAVGSFGAVRRTTNGGSTWTRVDTGDAGLVGVALGSNTHGWAVGTDATILATTNTGTSWTAQTAPAAIAGRRLSDVVARDASHVVAVGDDGTIITTTTGGATWTSRTSGTTAHLATVAAWEDELHLAAGARGTILRSIDDGATWSAVPDASLPDPDVAILDVAITGPSTAWALTLGDELWRSDDAGITWQHVSTLPFRARGMDAHGRRIVLAGHLDTIARSDDGGVTFQIVSNVSTRSIHLRSVLAIDTHVAYAAGDDGYIYRHDSDASANAIVRNWQPPAYDWDSGGFFGVCLQDVGGAANPEWDKDDDTCEEDPGDPWRAVPPTVQTAASTIGPGFGHVDLVWGMRTSSNQRPGRYEASVVFEVISP